jgi:Family of unknown function (DUF6492)
VTNHQLDQVISACYSADAQTWKVAAPRIIKFIKAARYIVIVPDHEVGLFKSISPVEYEVFPETNYVPDWQGLLAKHNPPLRGKSYGWYLQQFIKLAAVAAAPPNSIVLIWDADTVPLKPLSFIGSDGRLTYYKDGGFHPPYFTTIKRLFDLTKLVNFSFISQCLVTKSDWMAELIVELEKRHNLPWMDAIIKSLDIRMGLCFSEYETLGTFINNKHSTFIQFTDRKWSRDGVSLVNNLAGLVDKTNAMKLEQLDYISFEKSQFNNRSILKRTLKKIRRLYLNMRHRLFISQKVV